jgi:glutaminyl-peptide cyclotransferase
MKKRYVAAIAVFLIAITVSLVAAAFFSQKHGQEPSVPVQHYTYTIVKNYPHNTGAFTEGLVFSDGVLYESTGEYGSSSLRRVDLDSGNVSQEFLLPHEDFGEGITVVSDKIIQLTWQNHVGFVYDKATFNLLSQFNVSTEGWGITYDGSQLIMSDGTSDLYFLNPDTFQKEGQVSVHDENTPVTNINELEYINGSVYANIWMQQKIAVINPQTGQVQALIDLTGIYQSTSENSVLNGIAYDSQTNRLYVTGKDWPNIYEINLVLAK